MASVNFQKMKSIAEVKSKIRHCDKGLRQQSEHRNKHIDKSITSKNIQFDRNYDDTCKRFDDRIAYLDSLPDANHRPDRVICFGLEIPVPADLPGSKSAEWANKCQKLVAKQYGSDNIIQCYFHRDEVHEYVDARTGQKEISRQHLHIFVVPEINGKLNGKVFSSASNMRKINKSIDDMSKSDYGIKFMDGSKRGSKKKVEELKRESDMIASEQYQQSIREREQKIDKLYDEALKASQSASQKLIEANAKADKIICNAKAKANEIIDNAKTEANRIIENKIANFDKSTALAVDERNKRVAERNAAVLNDIIDFTDDEHNFHM
jgi:F0F1-type ATP synthase membrane subunit b/b'